MSRLVRLAVGLALTLPVHAVELPQPAEKWVALEAESFRFISGVSPSETRQIAGDLLHMYAALGMVSDFDRHAVEPTRVFVFPTTARFAVYCRMRRPKCENVTGLFMGTIYNEGQRAGVFYARSWALVHYLMHDDACREQLSRFLDLLDSGKPMDAAFDEAFRMPFGELEEALRTYIRAGSFTVYAYPFGDTDISTLPEPAAMPYDAVLHQFGRLVAHARPQNAADAERFFREALAANGRNAGAYADLGRLYDATGRTAEADAAYAKVLELGSGDVEVYLIAGRGILHRDAAELAKARPLFQRATELAPQSAPAWAGLGASYLLDPVDRASGIAALEKSLDLDPDDEESAFYLAQLWSADGRNHRTVRRLAEALLARTTNDALKGPLTSMLAVASINEAVEKANAGHYVEALMLVDAALPAIQDEEARRQAHIVRDMIATEAARRR